MERKIPDKITLAPCKYCGSKPFLFIADDDGENKYILHCSNPFCGIYAGIFCDLEAACNFWNNGLFERYTFKLKEERGSNASEMHQP